jgi:hypothetical protein
MGGNAIKDKKTGKSICDRLAKIDYEKVKQYILKILGESGIICETVLELPGKTDFGDIDILYVSHPKINMREFVKKVIGLDEEWHVVINGGVMSFAFNCSKIGLEKRYFQIDFIKAHSIEHLEMMRFYLSYGDIGSIIGRISNYYGLKYGDAGLWCELFEHTVNPDSKFDVRTTLGKVFLSDNIGEICKYLDFDYNFWKNEIPKLEEGVWEPIYRWIMKSRFFKKDIFKCLNSAHRDRFAKRTFYETFVKYLGIDEVEKTGDCLQAETGGEVHNMQMDAIKYFKKEKEMSILIQEVTKRRERTTKFSGNDIITFYQEIHNKKTEGKNLGEKIQMIKETISKELELSWDDFLDNHEREVILQKIKNFVTNDKS